MRELVPSRCTRSGHCVPTTCRSIGYSTAAPSLVCKGRPKPPLNQRGRPAMLGLPLGGGLPFIVDDLSTIGSAQAALTVTRPNGRRGGACHGDVIPQWSNAVA